MRRGADLEDRCVLERPRRLRTEDPVGVRRDDVAGLGDVRCVVGPEIHRRVGPAARGEPAEEGRLHQPVLVVPALGPGIGKEHEDLGERDALRQRGEEIIGIGVDEGEVLETGAVALPLRAADAIGRDVESEVY